MGDFSVNGDIKLDWLIGSVFMEEKVLAVIRENSSCPDGENIDRATILGDVCDSLDVVNMAWDLEIELDCELSEDDLGKFLSGKTVGELVDHICAVVKSAKK